MLQNRVFKTRCKRRLAFRVTVALLFDVGFCFSLQDMVQQFLMMLTSHQDVSLRFLSFRLDFNEHYKKREPKLRSPLTHRFSKRVKTPAP